MGQCNYWKEDKILWKLNFNNFTKTKQKYCVDKITLSLRSCSVVVWIDFCIRLILQMMNDESNEWNVF